MKKHILILVCLLGTASSVVASPSEYDHTQYAKRLRTPDSSDSDTLEWLYPHERFSDLSFLGEESFQRKELKRQRTVSSSSTRQSSSSSSSAEPLLSPAASFGDALSRLPSHPDPWREEKLAFLRQYQLQYQLQSADENTGVPTLMRLASAALWNTCELHAQQSNLAPIMFLADAAKAYPFFGSLDLAYLVRPTQIVPDSFLAHCPAIDLTKYALQFVIPRAEFMSTPHVQSMTVNTTDLCDFFLEVNPRPFLPNLTSLCLNRGSSQDLWVLCHLTGLQRLDLKDIKAIKAPLNPAHFSMLKGLERLKLSYYGLADPFDDLPEGVANVLAGIPTLKKLSIKEASIVDAIPDVFGKLTSLTSLSVSTFLPALNDISTLGALTNLRSLKVSKQYIESIRLLWSMPYLAFLDASSNDFPLEEVVGLRNIRCLLVKRLWSYGCDSTPADLVHFAGLTRLRALDLRETFSYHPIDTREQVAVLARLNLLYLGLMDKDIAPAARVHFDELGVRYSADDMPKTLKRAMKHMPDQEDAPAA